MQCWTETGQLKNEKLKMYFSDMMKMNEKDLVCFCNLMFWKFIIFTTILLYSNLCVQWGKYDKALV